MTEVVTPERVATEAPADSAIAAICASKIPIGLPPRLRLARIAP